VGCRWGTVGEGGCRGEEAAAGEGSTLGSPQEVLNILEMSLVEANLARGVLACARMPIGAGGNPKTAKGCATGQLKKGCVSREEKGNPGKRKS